MLLNNTEQLLEVNIVPIWKDTKRKEHSSISKLKKKIALKL